MSFFARHKTALAAVLGAALPAAIACGGTAPTSAPPPPPVARVAPSASAAASSLPPELKGPEYTENDFVESDRNRDPFRSFIIQNQQVGKQALNQRKVELAQYSIDELKLVAIVQGSDQPRAMFVDPSGKGTVVYRGTFVCRPEVVHPPHASCPCIPRRTRQRAIWSPADRRARGSVPRHRPHMACLVPPGFGEPYHCRWSTSTLESQFASPVSQMMS